MSFIDSNFIFSPDFFIPNNDSCTYFQGNIPFYNFNPGYPKIEINSITGETSEEFFYCSICKVWISKAKKIPHCFDCDICVKGHDQNYPFSNFSFFPFFSKKSNLSHSNYSDVKSQNEIKIKFIGKKTEKKNSEIFSIDEYDDYSLEKIKETLIIQNIKNSKKIKNMKPIGNINNMKNSKMQRKFYTYQIRTKFIVKFFRHLINELNKKLENEKFSHLPRKFIFKITSDILHAKKSKNIFDIIKKDLTFEQIISNSLYETVNMTKYKQKRFEYNKTALKNLNNNIKTKTFSELFYEFLCSKQFKKDISYLNPKEEKDKDKNDEYIKKYITKAFDFIKPFTQ